MPPKRITSDTSVHRRKRKAMTLVEKVKICDKMREGCSAAAIARMYEVNKSTVRTIKRQEQTIRAAVQSSASNCAQRSQRVRDKALIKMCYMRVSQRGWVGSVRVCLYVCANLPQISNGGRGGLGRGASI